MGILISRFKKKKTTLEVLEKLEKDIKSIEKYRMNTEQRQRRIVGHLIVYSVGAYILAAALFYFYWFPRTFRDQLLYITPLLLFPIVVLLLKKIVTFYYSRKITRNEEKLCDLRAEKKKILEDVMEKEIYRVARSILEIYAPEQLRAKGLESRTPDKLNPDKSFQTGQRSSPLPVVTPARIGLPTGPAPSELRRRTLPTNISNPSASLGLPSSMSAESLSTPASQRSQFLSGTPMPMYRPSVNGQGFITENRPPGPPLPRPVLPRDRSYLDRFIEYLVGDGPTNRFALICSSCESHNGMALKEEFEYLPFRCCYCHYFNPARKQRPQAPRLSPISGTHSVGHPRGLPSKESDETSDSEKNSGSDSSDEDSGPELQPLETSEDRILSKEEGKTLEGDALDREAEEFLRSLGEDEKESAGEPENKLSSRKEEEPHE